MQNKHFLATLLILLFSACSSVHAEVSTFASTKENKADAIHSKIVQLLKKEIQIECSKIRLELHPKNIVEQLSQISDQIKAVCLDNLDVQNRTFSAKIETIDKHKISIFGMYRCLKSVPVLKNSVAAGQTIYEKDIKIKDFDLQFLSSLSADFIQNLEQIVGMQAKTNLKSNSFIYFHDIKNPVILKANEIIDLVLSGDGFTITAKGKAMQSGEIGSVIKVQNIKSKKILFGVIIDNKTVEIRPQ